jgi:dephospho-CoA kinase
MKNIVITGNIGCGKSHVTNLLWEKRDSFKRAPYAVINMDHETFYHVYGEGRWYLHNNFLTTDKRTISDMVFKSPTLLHELNKHFLPDIKRMFMSYADFPEAVGPCIIEFPLLFECFTTPEERKEVYDNFEVVAIYADDYVRYERAMRRDTKSIEQIRRVDAAQLPQIEKCKLADWVVVNNPSINIDSALDNLIKLMNGTPTDFSYDGIMYPKEKVAA